MKVRHQLLFVIICLFASILVFSIIFKVSIANETKIVLNKQLAETKEKDAPKILELNAAYIKNYTYDYSIWDQMVEFLEKKRDKKWAEDEIKIPLANYKVDYVWVLNDFAKQFYTTTTTDSFQTFEINIPQATLLATLKKEKEKSFFIQQEGRLIEIFAGGITKTNDKLRQLPLKGYLLLGRIVDAAYMAKLKDLSPEINFSVVNSSDAFLQSNNPSTGHFEFSIPLNDFNNKPIAAFNVQKNYPILKSYQTFLSNYLVYFLLIIAFLSILFYYISKYFLVKPLTAFAQTLQTNNTAQIEPYLTKKNEFGNLSQSLFTFFNQKKLLEIEVKTRQKSEQDLLKALEEKGTAQSEKAQLKELLKQQQLMLQFNAENTTLTYADVAKKLLSIASAGINCERVGIWEYNEDLSAIKADFIYLASKNDFACNEIAFEKDFPTYFKYLKKGTPIVANDALTDESTCEFADVYLKPEGITSMLDMPIRVGNKVIGVICCEHVGQKREWTAMEQMFIQSFADIVAINHEKEQRRKIEALLQKSYLRFEETQELAKIGSWEYSFTDKKVIWSKEMYKIFNLEAIQNEELFKNYIKKIHLDDVEDFKAAMNKVAETKETSVVEFRIINKKVQLTYVEAIVEAVLDNASNNVVGLRGTVQDITKQKQSALAKSDFLSCMSHEIRTPINGVIGVANLLMEEELTDKQLEYVRTLNFSAQHLSTVVSDILDFSKIEAGHMSFEKVSFDLEKNCSYIFDLFSNVASEKNISYTFKSDTINNCSLYGDSVRLNQVLSNLLSNAIKFTNKGNVEFSYSIKQEDNHSITVLFCVKDSGIGIPEQKQAHIFESFSQADESITRQYGGTGLGLTICKRLIELQGGKIYVDSKIDEGSTFFVELTFDKNLYKGEVLKAITTNDIKQEKNLAGMKILVAEDNKINAMVLTRFLSNWKVEYKLATDGLQAIQFLENEHFDMALMDIQMPNMDGIEATKHIRQSTDKSVQEVSIVAFTADASIDAHKELIKVGFNYCITKPFNPDTLFSYLLKSYKKKVVVS